MILSRILFTNKIKKQTPNIFSITEMVENP
jgi:hypothetical protein